MNPAAGELLPGSLPWSIVGAVWAWLLAGLLGATLLPLARRELPESAEGAQPEDPASSRLLAWGVFGIAVQSTVWLLLSSVGSLSRGSVLTTATVLTVVATFLGGRPLLAASRELFSRRPRERGPGRLRIAAALALVASLALTVRLAILPSVYYDDLVYHLGLPRQALLTGAWPSLPEFYPSFMPAAWETTYLLPFSLGGGSGPQLMNVLALALLAVVAYRIARRGAGPAAALAVTAGLLACSLFVGLGSLV